MRTVYLNATYFPAVELLSAVGTAVILLYGGYQAIDGAIEIGVVVAFVGYLATFFDPIQQLSQLYTTYQQGMAALDKIFDLLDTEPDMTDAAGSDRSRGRCAARSRWRGVWFSYGDDALEREADGASVEWALRGRRPARAAGPDAGAGRGDGRGQVDVREARRALLRPAARAGV